MPCLKLYLSSPYSHRDPAVKQARFEAVNAKAAELMSQGHFVMSPISHTHPIALAGNLPGEWDYWAAFDTTFIEWCDELWVYMQDGWESSIGVQAEMKIATSLRKPVRWIKQPRVRLRLAGQ